MHVKFTPLRFPFPVECQGSSCARRIRMRQYTPRDQDVRVPATWREESSGFVFCGDCHEDIKRAAPEEETFIGAAPHKIKPTSRKTAECMLGRSEKCPLYGTEYCPTEECERGQMWHTKPDERARA